VNGWRKKKVAAALHGIVYLVMINDYYRKYIHPLKSKIKRAVKEERVTPFLLWEVNEDHDNIFSLFR